jgi:hypothetical protein
MKMSKLQYSVLSLGAGVNSTALLFWLLDHKEPLDEVIFADTKGERPETYETVKQIKDFCISQGIKFTILSKGSLEEHCLRTKTSPSYHNRWCSCRFKRDIIQKYVKPNSPVKEYLGISYEEMHRMNFSNVKYVQTDYPLIRNYIDREGCKKIIQQHNFPMPIKSGCFFCPFQSEKQWYELYQKYPELYERAIKIEEGCKYFPKYTLHRIPLRKLKIKFGEGNMKLSDFTQTCEMGYCMV